VRAPHETEIIICIYAIASFSLSLSSTDLFFFLSPRPLSSFILLVFYLFNQQQRETPPPSAGEFCSYLFSSVSF
jgi:hypothetical protein